MRFEIRAGGAILILLGLAILSGVVFALGLAAGYQMARSTLPESSQVASTYSLPSSPAGPDTSAAKSSEEISGDSAATATTKAALHKPKEKVAPPPEAPTLSMDKNAGPVTAPSRPADALGSTNRASADTADESPAPSRAPEKFASATGGSPRHKPFNIQIDAVMDHTNADQMATRLQRLGYHAFLVPTDIGGQTWWRVRVGPYQSEDEASEAEQELRAKYKDTYSSNE